MKIKIDFNKGKKYLTIIGFLGIIIYLLIEVVYNEEILIEVLKKFIAPILILFLLNTKDEKNKPESAEKIISTSNIVLFVIGIINTFYIYGYIIGALIAIFKN